MQATQTVPFGPSAPANSRTMSDAETLKTLAMEFANSKTSGAWAAEHSTADMMFIRPSGNPISAQGLADMMSGDDLEMISSSCVAINKVEVVGDSGFVCLTQAAKFTYKGTPNDDICVITLIWKKVDGTWKISWGQRSTGRKPDEPLPTGF